jgi:hypothetical protein
MIHGLEVAKITYILLKISLIKHKNIDLIKKILIDNRPI